MSLDNNLMRVACYSRNGVYFPEVLDGHENSVTIAFGAVNEGGFTVSPETKHLTVE